MLYLTPGTKIRAFTLTKLLGKGGMSAVWKAHHAETGQDYALKILHGSVADDKPIRQRFFEEGLIQARISHPNVVAVKGRIEEHPIHALVMEYVDGPSLKSYVEERPSGLHLTEVKTITTGILSGLNASHRRNIIHRDVKPSNVILARDFQTLTPKLTDFGIAKVKFLRSHTIRGAPMGTPHFMSPEQLRDSHQVTHLTDIYSLGVTLYYMVTQTYPFDDEDFNQLMVQIKMGAHLPASAHRPSLPPTIDQLIERCMSAKPEERPQSVREVLETVLGTPWVEIEPGEKEGVAVTPTSSPIELGETLPDGPVASTMPSQTAPSADPLLAEEPEVTWRGAPLGVESDQVEEFLLARKFKRSSRIGLILVLVLLFAAGLLGTRYYLEYRERGSQEISDRLGAAAADSPSFETGTGQGTGPVAGPSGSATPVEQAPRTVSDAITVTEPAPAVPDAAADVVGTALSGISVGTAWEPLLAFIPPGTPSGASETGPVDFPPEIATATGSELPELREAEDRSQGEIDWSEQVREQEFVLTGREAERAAELAWERRQRERQASGSGPAPSSRERTLSGSSTSAGDQVARPASGSTRDTAAAGSATPQPVGPVPPTGDSPTQVADQLTPLQINRALRARRAQFRACFEGTDSGPVEMRMTIRPEGTVNYATALTPGADAVLVRCLVREISATQFDPFEGSPMNVLHTFTRVGP